VAGATNSAPTANAQSVSTDEDTNKAITLTGSDPDGNALTYSLVTAPGNGMLSGLPPSVTYAPNSNFHGSDSFTFKVYDGTVYSSAATVSITVNSVNDVPVISGQSVSTAEDSALGVTFSGTDADNNSLTWSIVTNPTNGSVTGGTGASRIYTPNTNFNGADSFTFKANDGIADSNVATISINVTAVNDSPTASSQSVSVVEDVAKSISLVASDPEGSALTWTIISSPSNGSLAVNPAAPAYSYTPNANFNGSDVFTFKVNDGSSDSNTATVTLLVGAVNDAPVAANQSVATQEDTAVGVTLVATDVDADSLSYAVVTPPAQGTLTGTGSARTYTPPLNWSGTDTFTFEASDGSLLSNLASVTITVNASNDQPVAANQASSVSEDGSVVLTLSATDNDASSLTYSLLTNPSQGTLSGTGSTRTYTPDPNYNGQDSFTWKANDGTTDSNTATYTLTVTPENDAPVASSQTVTVVEDTPTSISLSATDIDGDSLTYEIVTSPANGTVTGTGAIRTYSPDTNYAGPDSFTFKANDGLLDSSVVTVDITVSVVSDPPTADTITVSTLEDTSAAITLSGSDGDGDPLTFSVLAGPFNGSLTGTPPHLTYLPNPNYNGSDLFSYQAHDGLSASASVPVTITITAVNDAPVAESQSVSVGEDESLAVTLVASDVEGSPLTWTILTQPDNGSLTGTPPSLSYAPNLHFSGTDSFTFKVNDGALDSGVETLEINVVEINDLPFADAGGPYVVDEGSALPLNGAACSDLDGAIIEWSWDCENDGVFEHSSSMGTGDTCTYVEDGTYTLLLEVTDDDGGKSIETTTVTVNNVSPIITSMVTPGGVEGFMLQFEATATDPGPDTFTYLWDFGNGTAPGHGPTQHTYYSDDGIYTVTLTVTDDDGGATVQTAQVVITNADPSILGLSGDLTGDEGSVLNWTALAADPGGDSLTYLWDFGDGTLASGLGASHAYADNGNYTLTLTVSDTDGGSTSDTLSIAIANVAPSITNLIGDSSGDEGEGLLWGVIATDPGADVLTYSWDFGDGSPAETGTTSGHTYVDEGSYTLVVTVTDDDGGSVSDSMVVSVSNVAPVVLLSGDTSGVEGDLLGWSAVVTDAGIADTFTYSWNFGDGSPVVSSGTDSEAHVFLDEGSFDVALTVIDNGGAATTETVTVTITNAAPEIVSMATASGDEGADLSFTASASDAGSDTLLFTWDFGDGTLVSGDSVTHAYADDGSYTVTLTLDDGDGGTVSQSDTVTIDNVAPVIDAMTGPPTGPEGSALQWNVQAFDAGTADVLTYSWDWGDGSPSSLGSSPTHSYADEGEYIVSVVVSDDDGASVSSTRSIEVLNVAPVVSSITAPREDEGAVALLEVVAVDPGADTLTYVWDFGDGSATATGSSQSHIYADDGVFTATVTIEDGDGGSVVETTTATITNVAPEIVTLIAPSGGDEGSLLTFEIVGADAGADDVADLVATWDFGDGSGPVTGLMVQHAFPDDGQYTFSVVLDDQDGGTDAESGLITIDNVDPQVLSNPPGYASEDILYNYEVVILDPGSEEFTLSLAPSAPAAMTVDSATQTITWTPDYADTLGPDPVIVLTIDDGDGGTTQQTWSIQVGFADLDGDGMADQWELDHGFDPTTDDGASDPDVDGVPTYQEFLDGTDPTSFDGPEVPVALSPIDGEEVDTAVPFLTWANAFDPQLDELTYNVQVWEDMAMTVLIREELLLPENGWFESSWKVQPPLDENSTVYWRVRAKDAESYGPFSELEEFFVNAVSEPPQAPVALAPLDGDMVAEPFAECSWAFAVEPDQDDVTYSVQVLDADGVVVSEDSELSDESWELHAAWMIDVELTEDLWYGWRVLATDEDGLASEWSETQAFYYSLDNAAPYDVYFVWPLADDVVEGLAPTLQASTGYDPEGQALSYEFELDSVSSFDSADLLTVELTTDEDIVSWSLSSEGVLLTENQWYFARVRGVDLGGVASPWDTIQFMTHGVNEAPPAPTLVNPADGVAVPTATPTLVAHNVVDPEEDIVFYEFVVASDSGLSEVVASKSGLLMGGGGAAEGQTAWLVETTLSGSLFWAARAVDEWGAASPWSEVRRLTVNAEPDVDDTAPAAGCDCESSVVAHSKPGLLSLLLFGLIAVFRRRRGEAL